MKFVFTGLCLLVTVYGLSQNAGNVLADSLKARYNNQTITFFKGYITVGENGGRVKRDQIRDLFLVSPEGIKEYDLYQKKFSKSSIINDIGLSFVLAGAIVASSGGKYLGLGMLGLGDGLLITSIPIRRKASKKFSHAIWLRNRDAVFK